MNEPQDLVDCYAVAAMLRIRPDGVARLCRDGHLPTGRKVGNRWMVSYKDAVNYRETKARLNKVV